MLYDLLNIAFVIVCIVLLIVVLLQQGQSGDMASAFGGGGAATTFGARGGVSALAKITIVCAVLFMVGALILAIIGQKGPGSVISGATPPAPISAPVVPTSQPATPAPQPKK
jgi:preprotein translocase subunit SecG